MEAEKMTQQPVMEISPKEELGGQARLATEIEHQMTFFEAVKLYPTCVAWSIFFSLGIIMTAFDPQLLGNLYATPAFQEDFGYLFEGSYIISAPWQIALGMGNPIGQVLGALTASYPMEIWGRKKVFGYSHLPQVQLTSIDLRCLRYWHNWLYLHPVFCSFAESPPCWRTPGGVDPGYICNHCSCLCF